MRRRHVADLVFHLEPHGHRVDADVLAGQAREEELTSVLRFEERAKRVRHLESALVIYAGRGITPEHETPLLYIHFVPQNSTRIVEEVRGYVNAKATASASYAKSSLFCRLAEKGCQTLVSDTCV